MRIIHFACVAPPEIGGIGAVAAREVAGLRSRGLDARLIAPEPTPHLPRFALHDAQRSFIETVTPTLRVGNAAILPGMVERLQQADVIHLHYPFYGTAEPVLLNAKNLPPIVLSFHMDAMAGSWHGLIFGLHRRLVQPWLLPKARRILVSSYDYARRSSLRPYFLKHPERVQELPFGVDTDFFSPGPSAKTRFSIPESAPAVLFVGGLDRSHAFKGTQELIAALARLEPTTHLLIVGDGDLRPSYEDSARELGIADRVHFLGRVDRETLRDAYRSADVFAFPSTNQAEAFGLAALEASACGVPVVASDLPGLRTVVRAGETGLLVKPKDVAGLAAAMSTILSDPNRRRDMALRARALAVERFSWEKHLDGLLAVYRDVCASPS